MILVVPCLVLVDFEEVSFPFQSFWVVLAAKVSGFSCKASVAHWAVVAKLGTVTTELTARIIVAFLIICNNFS
ncbi:hypothetical protein EMIT07CA2_10209 [Brevibacillus sp. IT-7CA2]